MKNTSPLLRAMQAFKRSDTWGMYNGSCWVGTPTNLLHVLKKHAGDIVNEPGFPANVNRLGMALNARREELKPAGFLLASARHHTIGRLWIIGDPQDFMDEKALRNEFDTKEEIIRLPARQS